MTAPSGTNVDGSPFRVGPILRYVAVALASIVALTLLFTAQAVMRQGAVGVPVEWRRTLVDNALDWTVWGLLTPFIAVATRRYRLDVNGHGPARVAGWVAFALGCAATSSLLTGPIIYSWGLQMPPGIGQPPFGRFLVAWLGQTFGWNLITFCMVAGVFHALLYYRDLRTREIRQADLEARLARSELNQLRSQLQPHFFFNALHTVSALMVTDVPTAHRVLAALSDLLRASLDHTAEQEISLGSEIEFVVRYVEIQQARYRDRLKVHIDVPIGVLDALVPSLVLQPLVDNAIRHGIEAHRRGGQIWIRAARENGVVVLAVRDDASAESSAATPGRLTRHGTSGIGLANISARLAQLYGPAHSFAAGRDADGCFSVTITLPHHLEPVRPDTPA